MQLVNNVMALWNAHDTTRIGDYYDPDFFGVDVALHEPVVGHDGLARQMQDYITAFPDLQFTTERTVCQDESVALYWTAHGTHTGSILNIPPTGRRVDVRGVTFLTVLAGRVKEAVHVWDMAGLLRSLGLLPDLLDDSVKPLVPHFSPQDLG